MGDDLFDEGDDLRGPGEHHDMRCLEFDHFAQARTLVSESLDIRIDGAVVAADDAPRGLGLPGGRRRGLPNADAGSPNAAAASGRPDTASTSDSSCGMPAANTAPNALISTDTSVPGSAPSIGKASTPGARRGRNRGTGPAIRRGSHPPRVRIRTRRPDPRRCRPPRRR